MFTAPGSGGGGGGGVRTPARTFQVRGYSIRPARRYAEIRGDTRRCTEISVIRGHTGSWKGESRIDVHDVQSRIDVHATSHVSTCTLIDAAIDAPMGVSGCASGVTLASHT